MLYFRTKIRIFWVVALIVAVFVLVWLAIIPFGKATYLTNFKGFNDFIGPLTPKDRVVVGDNKIPEIIGDPAYFSLRTSRTFKADGKISG
jgi:hypothetical protein